jgi:hypothetical protein
LFVRKLLIIIDACPNNATAGSFIKVKMMLLPRGLDRSLSTPQSHALVLPGDFSTSGYPPESEMAHFPLEIL